MSGTEATAATEITTTTETTTAIGGNIQRAARIEIAIMIATIDGAMITIEMIGETIMIETIVAIADQ